MSGTTRSVLAALFILMPAGAAAFAGPSAPCPRAAPTEGKDIEPLFDRLRLDRLERLKAEFSEEKHIALLARPLRQAGTIYFDRSRGIARLSRTPRAERMVLTATTLRIDKGNKREEIRLAESKALRGFALVFPALLRGERAELEKEFALRLGGTAGGAWSLTLTPKDPALCGLVTRVVVSGRGADVVSLEVVEASGDTTSTRFSAIARNDAVPAAEVARGFGGP